MMLDTVIAWLFLVLVWKMNVGRRKEEEAARHRSKL